MTVSISLINIFIFVLLSYRFFHSILKIHTLSLYLLIGMYSINEPVLEIINLSNAKLYQEYEDQEDGR